MNYVSLFFFQPIKDAGFNSVCKPHVFEKQSELSLFLTLTLFGYLQRRLTAMVTASSDRLGQRKRSSVLNKSRMMRLAGFIPMQSYSQ